MAWSTSSTSRVTFCSNVSGISPEMDCPLRPCAHRAVENGSVIDTKGWAGWEWTHGIALTALYRVSCLVHAGSVMPLITEPQHAALDPSGPANQHSMAVALDWFRAQYKRTKGRGAHKNINTMSPFYCLAGAVADGLVPDEERAQWMGWLEEWAEWVMRDLPSDWRRCVVLARRRSLHLRYQGLSKVASSTVS